MPTETAAPGPRGPTLGHVGALDGIRALAVVGVLLYHAGVQRVRGGFLGVDVFFVLSGFLITSLLVSELERSSTIRFGRFYERRARRLLPALVLLVALVVLFTWVVAPHGSYPSLPTQILGTMAYVGNWTLISHHASYFAQGLPLSPLEHTWSLAIEEQFYLVWPGLLWLLWHVTSHRRALAVWCVGLSAGCAALTAVLYGSAWNIDALYFSTETHATTMLLGAALACLVLAPREDARRGDSAFLNVAGRAATGWNVVGVVAWLVIIAMFLVANGGSASLFKGGYFVIGAVVATAICATVLVPGGWSARALALAPVAFVGRISYGVYLYHFPLFIWLNHARTGLSGTSLLVVRLAVTFAVAYGSYELVEQPIRQRRWLRGWRGLVASVAGFAGVAVLAFSMTASAAIVPFADRIARWNPAAVPSAGAAARVLVIGDSMAQTLGDGLNNVLARAEHVYFAVSANPKCSLVVTELRIKGLHIHPRKHCSWSPTRGLPAQWHHELVALGPSMSMVLFRGDTVDHRLGRHWVHIGNPAYDCVLRARLLDAAAVLSSTGRPVLLLTTPYYATGEKPDGSPWAEDQPSRVRAYNRLLRAFAANYPGVVRVFDLNALVSPGGHYARTLGPTVIRWVDGVHFTYAGDSYVLPNLLPTIHALATHPPTPAQLASLRVAAAATSPAACLKP